MKADELVLIEWQDAWASASEELHPVIHRTVGFVHRKTKDQIVLMQSYYVDEERITANNYFGIPRGCIKKIKRLK